MASYLQECVRLGWRCWGVVIQQNDPPQHTHTNTEITLKRDAPEAELGWRWEIPRCVVDSVNTFAQAGG